MSDQGNIPYSREFIELQSEVLKALSHPTRIEIVYMLQEGPLCVCEIVDILKGEYSNISRHLTKLARAGVLSTEKKGTSIYYALSCPCIVNFLNCINNIIITGDDKRSKAIECILHDK